MASRALAAAVFVALSALALDAIFLFQGRNGYFDLHGALLAAPGDLLLPETGEPARTRYTGWAPLDAWLVQLLVFFWPVAAARLPALSVFAVYMAGQCFATHTLVVLEGLRAGNRRRVVSFSTIWGMIYQSIPWGIIKPLYWVLYLLTSPTARLTPSSPRPTLTNTLAPTAGALRALPPAMIFGYLVPTALVALPKTQVVSLDARQLALAFWQAFPLWVGLLHAVFSLVLPGAWATSDLRTTARNLRRAYRFTLGVVALVHLWTLAYCLLPEMRPASFVVPGRPEVGLAAVFVSPLPTNIGFRVRNMSEGVLVLLQYDMYFACGATLLWAGVMACWTAGAGVVGTVVKAVLYSAFFGPGGAALAMTWERDEKLLLSAVSQDEPAETRLGKSSE